MVPERKRTRTKHGEELGERDRNTSKKKLTPWPRDEKIIKHAPETEENGGGGKTQVRLQQGGGGIRTMVLAGSGRTGKHPARLRGAEEKRKALRVFGKKGERRRD